MNRLPLDPPGGGPRDKYLQIRLRVPACLAVGANSELGVGVFVETGAEISLVRRGLLPDHLLRPYHRHLQLLAANGQVMKGEGEGDAGLHSIYGD